MTKFRNDDEALTWQCRPSYFSYTRGNRDLSVYTIPLTYLWLLTFLITI